MMHEMNDEFTKTTDLGREIISADSESYMTFNKASEKMRG